MNTVHSRPLGPTRSLLALAILVLAVVGIAQALWSTPVSGQGDPGESDALTAVTGTPTEWPGRPAVERIARRKIGEVWGVAPQELVLDFGRVRSDWIPGAGLTVELRGTGRAGYWIVAARDARDGLSLRVRAGVEVLRPTAARALDRGTLLTEQDVVLAPATRWGVGERTEAVHPVGWEVRRRIGPGEVLQSPAVAPPAAVSTGAAIEIELRSGAVSVRTQGTALGTALTGDSLYVRTATGERLRGKAVAPGRVVVRVGAGVDR